MTAAHNSARAEVGVPPLKWSDSLAAYAQQWAEYLARGNGCKLKHRSDGKYGENLYWSSAVRWSDGRRELKALTVSRVVAQWVSEKKDYDYAGNRCSGAMCGHYTQIVWRDTRRLGCGMAVCPSQGQIWVCNYDPPGNYVGRRPW
ncbi:MAG: pathogenesis-related family 1 protein [Methylohalobius sp. ZOD2]|nr:pathogenesis-related family 1 protein [Methylothermaceae bacterium]